MATRKAALDALKGSQTGFDLAIPPEDVPGVHPVIAGASLNQFTDTLPSLPIPPLDVTLDQYIACLKPLLKHNPQALSQAIAYVEDFRNNTGPILQSKLIEFSNNNTDKTNEWPNTHWLEKTWDTLAYLSDRVPLPLNVNCMGTLFECTGTNYPTWRCGAVLHGLLRFDQSIRNGTLSPESLDGKGKTPLCMYQYSRLFRHSRVPTTPTQDEWINYTESKHICVNVNHRWYQFTVIQKDGTLLTASECVRELDIIKRLAQEDDNNNVYNPNLCSMTCGNRTDWHYNRLALSDSNSTACTTLLQIESAIFHISLSSSTPETPTDLMNLGCTGNGRDVWMDKSFTMIVTSNGKMVFNMEHSHADAPMHSRMIEYMKQVVTKEIVEEFANEGVANVQSDQSTVMALRFGNDIDLGRNVRERLFKADAFTTTLLNNHCLKLLNYKTFGKVLLKSLKTSPDSFIQCVLQLSFYRDQSRFTSTYETGTTRAFHHGRTETIRSLTSESRELCLAMEDRSSTDAKRYALLRKALKSHSNYLRKSCQGMGIDRHLLGLRMTAAGNNIPMPSIFTDSSYTLMNTFELSTSSMAVTHYEDYLGFGAPSPTSYGCCYCMTSDCLKMVISGNSLCTEKNVNRFHNHIEQAMIDLVQVLQSGVSKV